jgi:hypothetical protein
VLLDRERRKTGGTKMPQYLFSYRGPKGYTPTEDTMPKWRSWFDGMGEQFVTLGNPVSDAFVVGNCSSESTELDGYSIVAADDLDGAVSIAKGCPHLGWNGGVEVALVNQIPSAS